MKGSAVALSLKALASKLHPQLPLSSRESQRLLNALTTSFRQHLDEAHPQQKDGDGSSPRNTFQTRPQNGHSSSVTLADKHLASVLTSPLLMNAYGSNQPVLNLGTARLQLQKDPNQDPITLLEDYRAKGAANLELAVFCLESFSRNLAKLTENERAARISETQAGKRTLVWLTNSTAFLDGTHAQQRRLLTLCTRLMMKEGYESALWEWLQSNMAADRSSLDEDSLREAATRKSWVIAGIISSKIENSQTSSADAALDAFFHIDDYRNSLPNDQKTRLSLQHAKEFLLSALRRSPVILSNTDPGRVDRFIDCLRHFYTSRAVAHLHQASLHLLHPKSPTALPALRLLKDVLVSPTTDDEKLLHNRFEQPKNANDRAFLADFMLRTATELKRTSRLEDARLVSSELRRLFPALDGSVEEQLKLLETWEDDVPTDEEKAAKTKQDGFFVPGQGPLPSFG